MSLVLNIETSASLCSVSLSNKGKMLSYEEEFSVGKRYIHSEKLTVFIQQVLDQKSIDISNIKAVAFSVGPGSYTGLRIACSVSKGICYALDIPLLPIDTTLIWYESVKKDITEQTISIFLFQGIGNDIFFCAYDSQGNCIENIQNISMLHFYTIPIFEAYLGYMFHIYGYITEHIITVPEKYNVCFFKDAYISAKNMVALSNTFYQLNNFQHIDNIQPIYLQSFKIHTETRK